MSLPQKYNQMFIDHTNTQGAAYNDAEEKYGVTITPVADPSQPHWRVVGAHHLTEMEGGHNNAFVDVVDAQGKRIYGARVEAKNVNGDIEQIKIHKDRPDPGLDFVLWKHDKKSVYVVEDRLPSDRIDNLHTGHDDEGVATRFHHAFYLVFQYSPGVTSPGSSNGSGESGAEPPEHAGVDLEALLWATGEPLVQPFNREAALYKAAQAQGLGEHLTVEYEVMHQGKVYLAQIFEAGLAYVPFGQWNQVKVLDQGRDVKDSAILLPWDHHITGFYGSRWNLWEDYIQGQVPGLAWQSFNETFTTHNPQVVEDQGIIKPQKVYVIPRLNGQPGAPATHPAATPAKPDVETAPAAPAPSPEAAAASAAAVAAPAVVAAIRPEFVQVHNEKFYINGKPSRFIGVNLRGLVHYGHIPKFPGDPNALRRQQLQAAKDMNARLVRVFLPQKHTDPQDVVARLQETINLLKAEFPGMYLMPALTDLYIDAEFIVKGDEHFYESPKPNTKQILNHAFYSGGYKDNYEKFVKLVVETFKAESQIFAWEIGNEMKAEEAPDLLVNFMTTMARQIKSWDSNHMVTTGMISTRHAFMAKNSPLRDRLYGCKDINFITIHAYNGNENPHREDPPPTEDDSDMARKYKKPFIIEEAGFNIQLDQYRDRRPEKTREDMAKWFRGGASCYMPWAFVAPGQNNGDGDHDVGMSAPLQNDYESLYHLHQQCAEILNNPDVNTSNESISKAITNIGLRELRLDLIWPLIVDGFDFPVGKPDADDYYIAAGLVDPNYHADLGFWHTGEDWNGRGGGDTDLGHPVFATAHGLVITSQFFPVWGNIVLIEHILPTGRKVWSQYAHLNDRFVKKGDVVRRGDPIGTIGKGADNRYLAHLHFEIRLYKLPASKWGWKSNEDRQKVLRYYAHPSNFIKNYRPR